MPNCLWKWDFLPHNLWWRRWHKLGRLGLSRCRSCGGCEFWLVWLAVLPAWEVVPAAVWSRKRVRRRRPSSGRGASWPAKECRLTFRRCFEFFPHLLLLSRSILSGSHSVAHSIALVGKHGVFCSPSCSLSGENESYVLLLLHFSKMSCYPRRRRWLCLSSGILFIRTGLLYVGPKHFYTEFNAVITNDVVIY